MYELKALLEIIYIYRYVFLLIAILATLDRLREVCQFHSWFLHSLFWKLSRRLREWLRGSAEGEIRYIVIFGLRIKLHPMFWDGPHFFKNFGVLTLLVFLSWESHWIVGPLGALVWYLFQVATYGVLVNRNTLLEFDRQCSFLSFKVMVYKVVD